MELRFARGHRWINPDPYVRRDQPCLCPIGRNHRRPPITKEEIMTKAERKLEKKVIKVLQLDSCLKCPHHGTERDPSSGDSFDWQDTSLVCYNVGKAKKGVRSSSELGGYPWKAPARVICGYSRDPESEYKRDGHKIPDWCPL